MAIAGQIACGQATNVSSSESIYRGASDNYEKAVKLHQRLITLRDRLFGPSVEIGKLSSGSGGSCTKPVPNSFIGQMQIVNSDTRDMLGYIEVVLGEIESF